MALNKALLRKVAAKLRRLRHEEHYDQGKWINETACGTAACIAGHLVLSDGCKPAGLDWTGQSCVRTPEGDTRVVFSEAKKRAGLTARQANILFDGDPYLAWPKEYADRWANVEDRRSKERPSRIAADLLDAIADDKVKL